MCVIGARTANENLLAADGQARTKLTLGIVQVGVARSEQWTKNSVLDGNFDDLARILTLEGSVGGSVGQSFDSLLLRK